MSETSPSGAGQQPPSASSRATVPPSTSRETIPPSDSSPSAPVQRETIHPGQSDSVAEVAGVGGGALPPQFGRYRLEECLGQGAMGAVYKAHDSQLDRLIAIKIPKFDAADTALLERFYREARAAATLSHPNICPVFDVGEIVVLDAGKGVSGYGVSRPFGHGKVIGPIVASDETDAVDLFHALLSPGIIRVDRPADAVRFGQALEGAGLFGQEVCDEMELGCWPTVDPGRQVFAMASHAWG